ncbi:hypothetical protein EVAR_20524_1 [Eumeta japonica]|uniref:Uncharacterized protein n=1 Tax=Eumeta variegata TaxID=151549 RepID=A0A4C1VJX4_EUMVA|nr:hypothetical protein EVAR_20524_1 [Eumeta japonica]
MLLNITEFEGTYCFIKFHSTPVCTCTNDILTSKRQDTQSPLGNWSVNVTAVLVISFAYKKLCISPQTLVLTDGARASGVYITQFDIIYFTMYINIKNLILLSTVTACLFVHIGLHTYAAHHHLSLKVNEPIKTVKSRTFGLRELLTDLNGDDHQPLSNKKNNYKSRAKRDVFGLGCPPPCIATRLGCFRRASLSVAPAAGWGVVAAVVDLLGRLHPLISPAVIFALVCCVCLEVSGTLVGNQTNLIIPSVTFISLTTSSVISRLFHTSNPTSHQVATQLITTLPATSEEYLECSKKPILHIAVRYRHCAYEKANTMQKKRNRRRSNMENSLQ